MAVAPFKAVGAVVVLPAPGTGPAATACPAPHRHAALITQILDLLAGNRPPPPMEPLSESELRVLRYLPTNLTGPKIAGELYVSRNTVKATWRPVHQARYP
jgi:LuxR family maltose regulon positive regulatory protein